MHSGVTAAETMIAALFAADDPRFSSIVVEAREAALRMLNALADAGAVDDMPQV